MNARETRVVLVAPGLEQEFEFSHAERLLNLPNNGGWHLPEDSPFEFVDNAIISRRVNRKVTKKQKGGNA